jgi:hypothetical protein
LRQKYVAVIMQLCHKQVITGRGSTLPGEPSSKEAEKRTVLHRIRMTNVPTQVISHSRMRSRRVNFRGPSAALGGAGVATAGTRLFYRPGAESCGTASKKLEPQKGTYS